MGKEETGMWIDLQMFSFQRGSLGVHAAVSLSHSYKNLNALKVSLMDRISEYWAPEVAGTTPGKSRVLCFSFLFCLFVCL